MIWCDLGDLGAVPLDLPLDLWACGGGLGGGGPGMDVPDTLGTLGACELSRGGVWSSFRVLVTSTRCPLHANPRNPALHLRSPVEDAQVGRS